MATESAVTTVPTTAFDEWIERLTRPRIAVIIGLGLTLPLIGAAYLDGVPAGSFNSGAWRESLAGPILLVYTLFVTPLLAQFGNPAIEAFQSLMNADAAFDQLQCNYPHADSGGIHQVKSGQRESGSWQLLDSLYPFSIHFELLVIFRRCSK